MSKKKKKVAFFKIIHVFFFSYFKLTKEKSRKKKLENKVGVVDHPLGWPATHKEADGGSTTAKAPRGGPPLGDPGVV
jgi:hypothetical protein